MTSKTGTKPDKRRAKKMPDEKKRSKNAPRKTVVEELRDFKPKRGEFPVDPNAHLPAVLEPEITRDLVVAEILPDPFLLIPEGLAFEEWAARAPEVKQIRDSLNSGAQVLHDATNSLLLRLADYLNYGSKHYSEEQMAQYTDAEVGNEMYGYSYESIRQAQSLARKIPPQERAGYKGMTYTHLLAVSKMEEKDRKHWLERAMTEHINAANLRRLIEGREAKKAGKRAAKGTGVKAKARVREIEEQQELEDIELPKVRAIQFTAEAIEEASKLCYALHSVLFDQAEVLAKNPKAKIEVDEITDAAKAVAAMVSSLLVGLNEVEAARPTQAA